MTTDHPPRDHALPDAEHDDRDLEDHVKSRSTWIRLLYMLVFCALYAVSRLVVFAVVVLQFLWVLFTGAVNAKLTVLGHSLATYTAEIIDFLTFNTDAKPFPFDKDWPVEAVDDDL
ncbi:MAG: DUF4389 domain-containing protein [Gammaproteobacteria bacterium]|nr:DUF4389 domain-containing protein [Gammaproteobacteria bacterium]MDH4253630.1 DUF4389 domain-containing protein [Gammaproteobacteria bacterium]MDH5311474.1 DUF4389 domain-containing protein [Gammaproteobacteria bacterium]